MNTPAEASNASVAVRALTDGAALARAAIFLGPSYVVRGNYVCRVLGIGEGEQALVALRFGGLLDALLRRAAELEKDVLLERTLSDGVWYACIAEDLHAYRGTGPDPLSAVLAAISAMELPLDLTTESK